MQASFEPLCNSARLWADTASAEGWLNPNQARALSELDARSPASLFEAGIHRPLVAAFFGGTGVGKSTLLNRLAGQDIARTGVERPTSREVSLYLHASVQIKNLPEGFPLDSVRIAQHHDERRRQVLWIDMPDIDSIEQHNRAVVLEWLPHIDVLIYVVSPERYRDDKGWRLLQRYGGEHAWLFVLNQWDRAHPAQYEDFARLLGKAGFRDPLLLRTDCRGGQDDFGQLQEWLGAMADQHVMRQLEVRAESLRRQQLRAGLESCLQVLEAGGAYTSLEQEWRKLWERTRAELVKGLEWPLQSVARAFVGHDANMLNRTIDLKRSTPREVGKGAGHSPLWDEWAENRWQDALECLVVTAGDRGLPAFPLKAALEPPGVATGAAVVQEGQRSLRWALANPGNVAQRFCLRLSGTLAVVLPLLAIGLVSYQVLKSYYESALNHLDYLGVDFAIHSSLFIGLSWLLPWFLYRSLKPSAEATAIKGLRKGIGVALERAGEEVGLALRRVEQERTRQVEEGRRLADLAALAPPSGASSGLLERVIPDARPVPGSRV